MATKKKSSSGSDPKSKRTVKSKMQKVMHEYKHHELQSGSGKKVKNPKQAIAIGLSEARHAGANIPENPRKKAAAKKSGAKHTGTKHTSAKKSASKTAGKKTAGKKTAAKKSTAKRTTAKKSSAKKTASRR